MSWCADGKIGNYEEDCEVLSGFFYLFRPLYREMITSAYTDTSIASSAICM